MIFIKMSSGLGNQLFQYALYESLVSRGREVKVDLSYFKKNNRDNRQFQLLEIFDINLNIATNKELFLYNYLHKYISKIFNFIGLRYKKYTLINGLDSIKFYETILLSDNIYVDGYWQSEKYFEDIKTELINKLEFKRDFLVKMELYQYLITNDNAVSIHVRRGDYVGNKFFYQLSDSHYYENSIDYVMRKIKDPKFLVFSDDVEWCKNRFRNYSFNFVDTAGESTDLVDFYLMTCCQSNIIANSSFSWWGAWLNRSPYKLVICPNIWFAEDNSLSDILPSDWIQVSTSN